MHFLSLLRKKAKQRTRKYPSVVGQMMGHFACTCRSASQTSLKPLSPVCLTPEASGVVSVPPSYSRATSSPVCKKKHGFQDNWYVSNKIFFFDRELTMHCSSQKECTEALVQVHSLENCNAMSVFSLNLGLYCLSIAIN